MAQIKVAVLEVEGVDFGFPVERLLDSSDCFFDPLDSGLTANSAAGALRELATRETVAADPYLAVPPYFLPHGQNFTVPMNKQSLFSITIEVQGNIHLDGILVEV